MSVKSRKSKRLIKLDTSELEDKTRDFLLDIVNEEGLVSRYILEGHLLYTIGCTNIQMDNIVMSLKNSGELYSVSLSDGEYYRFFPDL